MEHLLFIAMGWFVGGFVNGLAGFGAAMVALPIISYIMDVSILVPSATMIVLTLNCHAGWIYRKHIEWRYTKTLLLGAIPGVVLSAYALQFAPEQLLRFGMGAFVAFYALWSLFFEKKEGRVINPAWGYVAGVLSSSLGMAFSFNGPPLAVYTAYCGCPKNAVKAILSAGFIITGVLIVSTQIVIGNIDTYALTIYAVSVPAVVFGSRLGIYLSAFISEASYRKFFFVLMTILGIKIAGTALQFLL
ncbi:sulfite exporter TauE/SafE family protein [Halodesulfovibrio sp. MK-HDV]|jgi:uncharacterized protein|uniref:sulfite exporter TauE/SafE family protein n=1 Tax=unclassified Halodesulfovibrio TaxID=2644657 RepID=UPI00136927A7|nr:sulfite exporter TauE/SafE family protein [Halodesulfovibrio sp. MK-HDV]KAF1077450.1 hypothetical protein MKHDV_00514 [Halodesulfovibrio sp. MK-HDV]